MHKVPGAHPGKAYRSVQSEDTIKVHVTYHARLPALVIYQNTYLASDILCVDAFIGIKNTLLRYLTQSKENNLLHHY